MKSIFNNNLLKYLTCIMILLNGVLFSLVATFYMDIAYFNKLSMYPIKNDTRRKSRLYV